MEGIITKTLGGFFFVADKQQKVYKTYIRGRIQQKVYPGDRVRFCPEKKLIKEILPRDTLLKRPTIANVEQVLLVQSYRKPEFNYKLLDRFLILVEAENLQPLIIINKIDLAHNHFKEKFKCYKNAGYNLCFTSAKNKEGISKIKNYLSGKINVTAGPSGAGKSSIINCIIPEINLPVAEVSKKLKRGVHTTRHVELLPLPGKGWIADTPGFTSLNIDHIKPENLNYYFPEFDEYRMRCKFNTCTHIHEPGCAIQKAVKEGNITLKRYHSYRSFYEELNS